MNMAKKSPKSSHVRKNKNTFAGFQKARVEDRGVKIDQELVAITKSKAVFTHLTYLARHVAEALSNENDGNCAPSTLLRNNEYKAKLLSHLRKQPGTVAKIPKAQNIDDIAQQIELSNLRSEVARLKSYIAMTPTPASAKSISADVVTLQRELSLCQQRLAQSNAALQAILDNTKGLIEIDISTGNIIDRAKKVNNVLFSFKPYQTDLTTIR